MPNKKTQTKINTIKEHLIAMGWEEDRYGNLKSEGWPSSLPGMKGKIPEGPQRYKFQATSLRHERKTQFGQWVRISSGYYKDLQIVDDKLVGLTR